VIFELLKGNDFRMVGERVGWNEDERVEVLIGRNRKVTGEGILEGMWGEIFVLE
jgi:hypothetical protein